MAGYDGNRYDSTARSWADGMMRDGVNALEPAPVAAVEAPIAEPDLEARAAKLKIEKIFVHTGGLGGQASVHWTIADRRFHVWLSERRCDEPEETVHSNPVTPAANSRRDEHRSLDRTNKTQAAIWAVVWSIVKRDGLVAKCRQADREKRDLEQQRAQLDHAIAATEHDALIAFRRGDHALNPQVFEQLWCQYRDAVEARAELKS